MRLEGRVAASLLLPVVLAAGTARLAPLEEGPKAEESARVSEEVLSAIRGRLEAVARNDVAAWAPFVAEAMAAPLEGALPSKEAWMRTHQSWPKEVRYWYGPLEDAKVRVHGDTAVVTFRARQFTEIGGQTTEQMRWQIETHRRQAGRWQLIAVADGVIPREPAVVRIDPAAFEPYLGEYEWAPGLRSVVARRGDALVERWPGQGDQVLLPEDAQTFFLEGEASTGDSSRVVFVKDAAGRVTHYLYRQWGATDRIVRKVR